MTAWLNTFYIGSSITYPTDDFVPLETLLTNRDIPIDPEETFAPFSAYFDMGNGGRTGVGFPKVSWTWAHREDAHIELLQELCPSLSSEVYIRTSTNEISSGIRLWRTFKAQMLMPPVDIDYQVGQALSFTIEFRRLIIQAERT